jgi:ABC-type glycerol-3-phosphate transport system permease component
MISYFSVDFIIYLGRWILSGFVMMLPLYLLNKYTITSGKYKEYVDLIIVQIIGAFIFWYLDQIIFKGL